MVIGIDFWYGGGTQGECRTGKVTGGFIDD